VALSVLTDGTRSLFIGDGARGATPRKTHDNNAKGRDFLPVETESSGVEVLPCSLETIERSERNDAVWS